MSLILTTFAICSRQARQNGKTWKGILTVCNCTRDHFWPRPSPTEEPFSESWVAFLVIWLAGAVCAGITHTTRPLLGPVIPIPLLNRHDGPSLMLGDKRKSPLNARSDIHVSVSACESALVVQDRHFA